MFAYLGVLILLVAFPMWLFAEFKDNRTKRLVWGIVCMVVPVYGAWSGAKMATTMKYNVVHRSGTNVLVDLSIEKLEKDQSQALLEDLKIFKQKYHPDYLTPARYMHDIINEVFADQE
jgi:hypothetical protein